MAEENIKQTVDRVLDGIAARRRAAMDKAGKAQDAGTDGMKKEFKEITLKFGKGCVGEEFQGKDGYKYREVLVPNPDRNDHRPWQTFVARSNHIHENQFVSGMWLKLPSEGHTTLRRSVVTGIKPNGRKIWGIESKRVTNAELKKMMEAYREYPRESVKDKLTERRTEATVQKPLGQAQNRNRLIDAEL